MDGQPENHGVHLSLDRYVNSITICNSLALLASRSSLVEYLKRIALLLRLQQCWTEGHDDVSLVCSSDQHNSGVVVSSDSGDSEEMVIRLIKEEQLVHDGSSAMSVLQMLDHSFTPDELKSAAAHGNIQPMSSTPKARKQVESSNEKHNTKMSVGIMRSTQPVAKSIKHDAKYVNLTKRTQLVHMKIYQRKPSSESVNRQGPVVSAIPRTMVGSGRVCPFCGRQFRKPSWLQAHLVTHTGERPYACRHPGCNKRFGQSSTRNFHETSHASTRSFVCVQCGSSFKSATSLRLHTRNLHASADVVAARLRHQCAACGRLFRLPGQMRRHARQVHADERLYACEVCSKRFKSRTQLDRHRLALHSEERPWSCVVCGKGFAQPGNLKTHMRTHTGEKPYTCAVCGSQFAHSGTLKGHMATHRITSTTSDDD